MLGSIFGAIYLVLSLPTNPGQFPVRVWPRLPLFRSSASRPFCKKVLRLYRNQPAVQSPLSENFAKKPSTFSEINPQSNVLSQFSLQKRPRIFQKYNPPSKPSWAGLPLAPWASVGRIRPKAGLPYLLFFSNYE